MRGFILLVFLFPYAVLAETISIRADEWYPMNAKPGANPPGYMIELATQVFGKIDYQLMPWSRAIEEVAAGRADCVLGGYRVDTPGFVFPSEHWGVDQVGVYVKGDDDWRYDGVVSLLERKVGVVNGYSYEGEIDALIKQYPEIFYQASGAEGLSKNIKMLVAGRLDTFIESRLAAQAMINEMGLSGRVKLVGFTNKAIKMYIACSPLNANSQELVNKVDQMTLDLRANGSLQKILQKYGLSDWK